MGCCSDKLAVVPDDDENLPPDIEKKTVKFEPGKLGIKYAGNTIDRITEGGQAEKLGIKAGYIIHAINGEEMSDDKGKIKDAISGCKDEGIPIEIEFIIPADIEDYQPQTSKIKKKVKKKKAVTKPEETDTNYEEEIKLTPMQEKFQEFAKYANKSSDGSTMSTANFTKFCVDAGLTDDNFPKNQIAITFSSVCGTVKKCTYEQFEELLQKVAVKKFPDEEPEEAKTKIDAIALEATPTQSAVTQTQEYNFSTEKRRGSRTQNKNKQPAVKMQSNKQRPLASLTDRGTKVDVRGVPVNSYDDQ